MNIYQLRRDHPEFTWTYEQHGITGMTYVGVHGRRIARVYLSRWRADNSLPMSTPEWQANCDGIGRPYAEWPVQAGGAP